MAIRRKRTESKSNPAYKRIGGQLPGTPGSPQKERIEGESRSGPKYRNTRREYMRDRNLLESQEIPIRSAKLARELIDIWTSCPEVEMSIETYVDDMFSSSDGDDRGFVIGEEMADGTKVNPKVLDVLKPFVTNVIGGRKLEKAPLRFLAFGDAMASIAFNKDFTDVVRVMFLPTWEMFRDETPTGILKGFWQKRNMYDDGIYLHPVSVVHWRRKPDYLYGKAITRSILPDWADLKDFKLDHRLASRAVGANAKVHRMPQGTDEEYKFDYIAENEKRMDDGVITDYYMGAASDRGGTGQGALGMLREKDPDLSSIIESEESRRRIIIARMGTPTYLAALLGLSAKDISGQPAMAYARRVNAHRGILAEGINQLCNTQLALHNIDPRKPENAYPIVFPKIYINQKASDADKAQEQEVAGRTIKSKPPKKKDDDEDTSTRRLSNSNDVYVPDFLSDLDISALTSVI